LNSTTARSAFTAPPARVLLAFVAAVLVACSTPRPGSPTEAPAEPQPLPQAPWKDAGPLAIKSGVAEWTDTGRERTITAAWSVPNASPPQALLLVLPGLAQGNVAPPALIEALAGAGFAVVTVGHPGNDASVWQGPEARRADFTQAAHRMYVASEVAQRASDVRLVLDRLATQPPPWLPAEAQRRVGVIGIGLGAQTAQWLVGETMARGQPPTVERRIAAAALLGPYVSFEGPSMLQRYEAVTAPLLIAYGLTETDPYGLGMTSKQRHAMVAELNNTRVTELRLPSVSLPGLTGARQGSTSGGGTPPAAPMPPGESHSRGRPGGGAPAGASIAPRANAESQMMAMPRNAAAERAARVAVLLSVQAFFEAQLLGNAYAREWLEGPHHPGPIQWTTYPAGRAASPVIGSSKMP
jgi:hypothetical protein